MTYTYSTMWLLPDERNEVSRSSFIFNRAKRRAETERDGTHAETRFGFPAKRTSPFISAGVSVQSAAGSRGVRISGSNAG